MWTCSAPSFRNDRHGEDHIDAPPPPSHATASSKLSTGTSYEPVICSADVRLFYDRSASRAPRSPSSPATLTFRLSSSAVVPVIRRRETIDAYQRIWIRVPEKPWRPAMLHCAINCTNSRFERIYLMSAVQKTAIRCLAKSLESKC